MPVDFIPLTSADTEEVIGFLTSNSFPFHVQPSPPARILRASVENGRFWNPDAQGYWAFKDGQRLGLAVLEDLRDPTPLFDLRLAQGQRGKGLGAEILRGLCDLVFTTMPQVQRFEGQTREDNIAMRKTFLRCGFLKEAHYRMGWPTADGDHLASIAYGLLHQDWHSGTVTTFEWDDFRS